MPCYRPISIANPSRHYANDRPVYLRVPCGKCEGCRQMKRQEWFFRSLIEYNRYTALGGSVFVFTLTFNDENLPFYTLPSGKKIACFNKRYVHNFIKYFRIRLQRKGYLHTDMKYLICSEFGERFHRPHHHGLMFFPYKLPEGVFLENIRHAWHYGFVGRGELGFRVTSPYGLEYVSKYITKDFGHLPRDLPDDFKDYAPNHWQSRGFGESFINDVIMQSSSPADFLAKNQFTLNFENMNVPIPRYYHLKLERVVNKEYSLALGRVYTELTDIGKRVKVLQFEHKISYDMVYLRTLNEHSLQTLFPQYSAVKDFVPDWSNTFYNKIRSRSISDICHFLGMLDLRKVALYRGFLRYYPVGDFDPAFYTLDVEGLFESSLCNKVVPPEFVEKGLSESEVVSTPLKDDKKLLLSVRTCSENHFYRYYERLARALDVLKCFSGLDADNVKRLKYHKIKMIKEYCQKYVEFNSY